MTYPFRRRLRAIAMLCAALMLAAAGVLLIDVGSASAHDQLLESTPGTGAALETSPSEVTLQFSDSVLTIGAIVLLVDQDEHNWVSGEPTLDGSHVTAVVDGELGEGAYEVRWRVVSADGHPISGIVPFTVGDAAPVARPTTSSTAAPDPIEPAAAMPASTGTTHDTVRVALIGAGGAAIALLIFGAITVMRRRRTTMISRSRSR